MNEINSEIGLTALLNNGAVSTEHLNVEGKTSKELQA